MVSLINEITQPAEWFEGIDVIEMSRVCNDLVSECANHAEPLRYGVQVRQPHIAEPQSVDVGAVALDVRLPTPSF
jgi:hypothetical protein